MSENSTIDSSDPDALRRAIEAAGGKVIDLNLTEAAVIDPLNIGGQ
ncbi:hypothetical protein [Mycetocola reblochoni]